MVPTMGEHKYHLAREGRRSISQQSVAQNLFSKLSLGESITTGPRFFRKNLSDLAAFRTLGADQNIMLFTPAVPNLNGENMDPFEPLGRALTPYHERVKHIPFTKDGFTAMHKTFVSYADAIIIVLAEPVRDDDLDVSGQMKGREAQMSLQLQGRFGKAMLQSLRDAGVVKPLILVVCTGTNGISENERPRAEPDAFGTVLCARDYEAATLEEVAWTLFESRV